MTLHVCNTCTYMYIYIIYIYDIYIYIYTHMLLCFISTYYSYSCFYCMLFTLHYVNIIHRYLLHYIFAISYYICMWSYMYILYIYTYYFILYRSYIIYNLFYLLFTYAHMYYTIYIYIYILTNIIYHDTVLLHCTNLQRTRVRKWPRSNVNLFIELFEVVQLHQDISRGCFSSIIFLCQTVNSNAI